MLPTTDHHVVPNAGWFALCSDARHGNPPASRCRLSEARQRLLEFRSLLLIASAEDPLLDALGAQPPDLRLYPQVLALTSVD
jgi:hypothetical protein